jgi:hypothetical protein
MRLATSKLLLPEMGIHCDLLCCGERRTSAFAYRAIHFAIIVAIPLFLGAGAPTPAL